MMLLLLHIARAQELPAPMQMLSVHQLAALADALLRLEVTREAMVEPEGAALHRTSLALLGSFCAEVQHEARKRLQAAGGPAASPPPPTPLPLS